MNRRQKKGKRKAWARQDRQIDQAAADGRRTKGTRRFGYDDGTNANPVGWFGAKSRKKSPG